ncbi:zinc finger protein 551-like isoform X2 [Bicyclus anynana]|uniref:Zinc finger protein 551-like isoform X2 n=1 Tax=Bicyclus anynana TaxID=110368 RepID=A0ABM3M3U4_BICAN|nr:zinc finger protein 551-like isoform X2 [Bicyclus anynana]
MQCCVPFCVNTSDNASTSEGTGITFHKLPSDENLRAVWLRALGIQDHHLPDPAVVCSQHFIDEDFYTTKSCVRQIQSDAIPSTVQMCRICLDSDSKLFLMSKHKLEEAYQQLTGLSLCRGTNLKQMLCVLCAQRLINFSRFRDLCLRAHSLMTDLLEQDEFITIQHKELMNCATKHLRCNLTRTTLGADCCDLYIDHTDEEEQTAAEESVVGDGATLMLKREDSSDSMSNADNSELVLEDDTQKDNSNNECVSEDEYTDVSIKLESMLVDEAIREALGRKVAVTEHVTESESYIKSESTVFGCTLCFADFVQEDAYNEHMIMYLQNGACDASQVCEPRAAVSRSCDSLVLQNKTGSPRLNDAPPPAAGCAQATVAPLSGRLAAKDIKVEATEEAAATCKREQILETDIGELDNQLSLSNVVKSTNCVVPINNNFKKPKKTLLGENARVKIHTGAKAYSEACNYKNENENHLLIRKTHTGDKPYSCELCSYKSADKIAPLSARLEANDYKVQATEEVAATWKSEQILETDIGELDNQLSQSNIKTLCMYDIHRLTNCVVRLFDIFKKPKKTVLDQNPRVKTHTGAKLYSCDTCKYKTANSYNFSRHKRTHTDEKPYSCETCNFKTADRSILLRHKISHTGEKPHYCEICNFKCIQKSNLLMHKRSHTDEKPYSCDICNYKCLRKADLLRHIITHTGDKPYSCETCNYKTANSYNFLRHKRTHTGEKPYSCETCSFKTADKSILLRHKRSHTVEKPFSCDTCNYKTARKSHLLKHKRTHTDEKPFREREAML